jgi:acetolactate synthase-1/2/3 large subunit
MTGQEIATAAQYGAHFVCVVVNNGLYGTIRMHQEREYPNRVSGTTLVNPDFAAYARSFGADGYSVQATAEFAPAFRAALAGNRPSIIELKLDPEAVTTRQTLSQLRGASTKKN